MYLESESALRVIYVYVYYSSIMAVMRVMQVMCVMAVIMLFFCLIRKFKISLVTVEL